MLCIQNQVAYDYIYDFLVICYKNWKKKYAWTSF